MLVVSPQARSRGFTVLSWSWIVSLTGDGVRMVALPLTAALLTADPIAVTLVAAAELLPWLLLALPAGALVDRWDPRSVVLAGHGVRVVLSLALAAALLTDRAGIAVLCAAAFTLTVADTFADAAQQVLLVRIVPARRLTWANARFRTIETLTLITVGPLVGGVLVAVSPGVAFAVDGLSFLVAAVLAVSLPRSRPPLAPPGRAAVSRLLSEVGEGLSAVVRSPVLRVLALTTLAASVAVGAINALLALFALQTLGLPVAVVPVFLVLQAAGVLLGARTIVPAQARLGEGAVLVAALAVTGAAFAVVGLVPHVAVVLPAYLVSGVGFGWWNVAVAARRQRVTPAALQGRVANATRTVGWGAMPLGAAAGGLLAAAAGTPAVFVAGGALLLLSAAVARPALLRPATAVAPRRVQDVSR